MNAPWIVAFRRANATETGRRQSRLNYLAPGEARFQKPLAFVTHPTQCCALAENPHGYTVSPCIMGCSMYPLKTGGIAASNRHSAVHLGA